ncbi:MAG TPA: envelope biogenesis factor ElyC [Candidatus Saccharimonadia bacterium]|nr:envelope biogenesis factor ElyC [Candidatus Saccharimonadia bacterium]
MGEGAGMFVLQKFVAPFLFPLPLILGCLTTGMLLLWCSHRQKAGRVLVSLGTLVLFVCSVEPIAHGVVATLEDRYPPVLSASHLGQEVRWIVVLDSGHVSDPRLPLPSQLDGPTLASLVEGIRLYQQVGGTKLVLSGGIVFQRTPSAEVMAEVAHLLGVKPDDVVLDTTSRNTQEEAATIRTIVKHEPFFLVTSAAHMPRAMVLFTQLGMQPLPAPAAYLAKRSGVWHPDAWHPSAYHLVSVQRSVYEYIGLAWLTLSRIWHIQDP